MLVKGLTTCLCCSGSDSVKIRSSRAAVVCLVLLCVLLLTAVIVLCFHIYTNINLFQTKGKNITEKRDQLLAKNTSLSEDSDWLLNKITNLTNERDELKSKNANLIKQRDQFKQERDEMWKSLHELGNYKLY